MPTIRTHPKTIFFFSAVFSLGLILLLAMPSQVQSIEYGSGGHSWISTPLSRTNNAFCTQSVPDATCKELCLINNGLAVPTGTLCCMDPGAEECPPSNTFAG